MKLKCKWCLKEFEGRKSRKFCSRTCTNEWKSHSYKGRKLTSEWKRNQSLGKRRENIVKHGEFKCEKCGKMFETNLSLRSHKSYCSRDDEPRNVLCDLCGKTFKRQRKLIHHQYMHEPGYLEAHSAKVKAALKDRRPQKSTSAAEILFKNVLTRHHNDTNVVHKFRIEGINHEYDFYVPSMNTIVEFDGDYWHGNKALHELTSRMKVQFRKDQSWTKAARDRGFEVIRVWASEAESYPNNLRNL